MRRQIINFLILFLLVHTKGLAQLKYACFESDKTPNLKIVVAFDEDEKAKYVRYKGQKDSIPIKYSKIISAENPGGIPEVYWEKIYLEIIDGKITGKYSFTNAGTYQLDVRYTRMRDKKEFYFKITESTMGIDDRPFRETPCF